MVIGGAAPPFSREAFGHRSLVLGLTDLSGVGTLVYCLYPL